MLPKKICEVVTMFQQLKALKSFCIILLFKVHKVCLSLFSYSFAYSLQGPFFHKNNKHKK